MRIAHIPKDHAVIIITEKGASSDEVDTIRNHLMGEGYHGIILAREFADKILTFPTKPDMVSKVDALMSALVDKPRLKKNLRHALIKEWLMEPDNTEHLEGP